jgi:hypothetical protein
MGAGVLELSRRARVSSRSSFRGRPAPLSLGRACAAIRGEVRDLRCGVRLVRLGLGRAREVPALAAVACAEQCLARPTGRRGALGDRGTCLPQARAPCRDVRVPRGVPRRIGPRAEPYGAAPPAVLPERWGPRPRTPLVNRDCEPRRGERCLEPGSVRGRQVLFRRPNTTTHP